MTRFPISLFFLIALLAAPAARAENPMTSAPAPQQTAPSGVMLADLRGEATPAYAYGSWLDRINRSAEGAVVVGSKGAQGDGGFCGNIASPADLSGMNWVDVALAVGHNNETPEATLGLSDADGTLATARIRIDQIVPGQPVWFRVPLAGLHAATGEYGGKVRGFDATKVAQWHVQGDWATKRPMHIVVIAVRAQR